MRTRIRTSGTRLVLAVVLAMASLGALVAPAYADKIIHYGVFATQGACINTLLDLEASGQFYDGFCKKDNPELWSLYITQKEAGGGGGGGGGGGWSHTE